MKSSVLHAFNVSEEMWKLEVTQEYIYIYIYVHIFLLVDDGTMTSSFPLLALCAPTFKSVVSILAWYESHWLNIMGFPKKYCKISLWRWYEPYEAIFQKKRGIQDTFSCRISAFRFVNKLESVPSVIGR